MKKGLIIAGASVLLLSGMVAGVFAKYQSKIDLTGGTVTAKSFYFNAENKTENFSAAVKLAPGESTELTFEINNGTTTKYSEVNMTVVPNWDVTGDLAKYLTVTWAEGDNASSYDLTGGAYDSESLTVTILLQDHGTTDTDNNGISDDLENYKNGDTWKSATWSMSFTATQAA